MRSLILTLIVLAISTLNVRGQNLDNFDKENPFTLSGNISAGTSLYQAFNRENRRSPFAYYITASPTINLYGFSIPISFTYRDQQGSITNPFNRFSFNPSYKWVKLYFGKNVFNINPYVMSGQLLNGYGVDLTPGKFRFSATYGTLQNPLAQIDTIVGGSIVLPNYKRTSASIKVGVGTARNHFDLIAFRAKDLIDASNVSEINDDLIQPEENIVLGTEAKFSPFKFFSFYANVAASVITTDQTSVSITSIDSSNALLNRANDIFTLNISTRLQFAGDAGFNFNWKKFGFGASYKRVDPFYKSLGTYYFQEDFENITANVRASLLQGKIRLQAKGGVQRNNLNDLRSFTRTRNILNVSATIIPSRNFSTNLRFSNFQSDRTPGFFNVNDTIRFAQTTTMYSITPRYSWGRERRSTFQGNLNYQQLLDITTGELDPRTIDNYTANLTYSLQFIPTRLGLSASLLGNRNDISERRTERLGGSLGLNKKLLDKKLTLTTSVGYFQNNIDGSYDGNSITARAGVRYRARSKYSFSFNINYLNRASSISSSFSEIRSSVRATYLFNTKKPKKK